MKTKFTAAGMVLALWAIWTAPGVSQAVQAGHVTGLPRAQVSPWWWDTFLLPPVDVGPIDTVAPSAPTVTSGPAASTDTDGDFSFAWTNAEAGGTNECSLDTGTPSYSSCAPPEDYLNRAAGSYTFRVRQVDSAGNAGNAVTRSFTVDAPYPGTRFYKTTGVDLWSSENVTAARVQNLYNAHMDPAHHGADDSTDFVVRTPIRWKDELVDENSTPTLAQMRDPNWGGYKWNHPGTYPEASEIDNMLDATCVQKGKCKVAVNMLLAATGGEDPPNFIATNSRWAWTGQDGLVRLKYYDAMARRYAEAFTLAAMERFDDPSVSSWKLQEYFSGATNLPADWDRDSYISGYETYLRNVEAGAPRDARNDRVTIYQTNPMTRAGLLEQGDFSGMMIGLADSDPQFFEEPAALTALRENLHGVVPMSTGLDLGQFNRHYQTTYPEGFPNPWGYSGATRIDTPQAAWYYGHCGPLPMDQEFISQPTIPTEGYTGAGSTTSRLAAMDQLGPGGTDHSGDCSPSTDDWGGVPFGD